MSLRICQRLKRNAVVALPSWMMSENSDNSPQTPTCGRKCGRFLRSARFKIYCSYALSAWGDRLWTFALALVLVKIGGNLRLTAVSGLVNGVCVLIFGASVGRWIDSTPRLKAARVSLTINNAAIALSAVMLVSTFYWKEQIDPIWNGALRSLLIAGSILLCGISVLAGTGSKIVLKQDWLVVVSRGNNEKLADYNAMMLRIDQTAMIISPLIAGQIMTSIDVAAGCVFIAAWNICSFGVEYYCLLRVYKAVPELAIKLTDELQVSTVPEPEAETDPEQIAVEILPLPPTPGLGAKLKRAVMDNLTGWKIYYRQSTFPAALSLALLFLTVMGLDGITTGYAYSQGLQENILAIARGVGAAVGILGSFIYPRLRSKVGLTRTGLYSLIAQISCLILAVVSIWLPGSPFDLVGYFGETHGTNTTGTIYPNETLTTVEMVTSGFNGTTQVPPISRSTCSIWAFLVSITTARLGLWMADLTITQTMQEGIAEHERGVVNGVQNSLQRFADMTKDILVIIFPDPRTFGLLIIVSFLAVVSGFWSYCFYSRKVRGHLLPHYKKIPTGPNIA